MGKIFIISFVCFAFIYAVLASMTTLLYRHKSPIDLSLLERAVLYRRATIGDRLTLFITNLFASVVAPPVYILAAIITFIIWAI